MIARPFVLLAAAALLAGGALIRDGGREAAPAIDGASLFRAKGCAACHEGPETMSLTGIGPDLHDAAAWAGTRLADTSAEAYLRQSIVDPQAFVAPGGHAHVQMPTLPLSQHELDMLVAYLLAPAASP